MKYYPWIHHFIPPEFSYRNRKSYIYFLIIDGKIDYIGKTSSINHRIAAHKSFHYKKYTFFRVIQCASDRLDYYERRWIQKFRPNGNRYIYKKAPLKGVQEGNKVFIQRMS